MVVKDDADGVSKRLLKGFRLPNLVVLVGPLFFLCFSAEEMWLVLSFVVSRCSKLAFV